MESLITANFSSSLLKTLGLSLSAYIALLIIHRLYLSPLAIFPGPKLAALTDWYAGYHDLIRGGQYVFVVEEMHQKYGPIVRIRPDTLHVKDHSFIDTLYPSNPKLRRERPRTVVDLFPTYYSMNATRSHELHRKRRAALASYFSKQNVRQLNPMIQQTLDTLLRRMDGWADEGRPVHFNTALRAATSDVIQRYAFGDSSERYLEFDDCNAAFFDVMTPQPVMWMGSYFPRLSRLLARIPPRLIMKLQPRIGVFAMWMAKLKEQIEVVAKEREAPARRTVFHEVMLNDSIPAIEKQTDRLADTAMVLMFAGSETTAATLAAIIYHLLTNGAYLQRLKDELETAMPDPTEPMLGAKLENLPFLNAVINEGLRLHPGATHRQDRMAPDEDMIYVSPTGTKWTIPAGNAVGMSPYFLNRITDIYEDPDDFLPDRFLGAGAHLAKYQLIFGKGARMCIGMNLAMEEMLFVIAGIFRRYSLYDPKKKVQEGPTLELYRTGIDDVNMWADYVTPGVKPGSQGLRLKIRHD